LSFVTITSVHYGVKWFVQTTHKRHFVSGHNRSFALNLWLFDLQQKLWHG
jgi:hypothetical protein